MEWFVVHWKSVRATNCASVGLVLSPYAIRPQSSCAVGSFAARASAALLNCDGSTLLFTKGARSVTWRPALHAGEAKVVKSPAKAAAVGTKEMLSLGSERVVVP